MPAAATTRNLTSGAHGTPRTATDSPIGTNGCSTCVGSGRTWPLHRGTSPEVEDRDRGHQRDEDRYAECCPCRPDGTDGAPPAYASENTSNATTNHIGPRSRDPRTATRSWTRLARLPCARLPRKSHLTPRHANSAFEFLAAPARPTPRGVGRGEPPPSPVPHAAGTAPVVPSRGATFNPGIWCSSTRPSATSRSTQATARSSMRPVRARSSATRRSTTCRTRGLDAPARPSHKT